MTRTGIMLITGTSRGIGRFLAEYYVGRRYEVIGCSRSEIDFHADGYQHFCLDVADERSVQQMFKEIKSTHGRLDVLVNNAGIASMNHCLLTPLKTLEDVMRTNFIGTFLFCREAAKLMQHFRSGRIINFTTVALPLKLEGEAVYASSKAAVESLTQILARELSSFNITINAVGPTPIKTDLIHSVPAEKIASLLTRQAIPRFGEFHDVSNVIDFFIQPESDFITGQILYLGGI